MFVSVSRRSFLVFYIHAYLPRMPLSIRIVPRPRFTVSFAYELASSTSNSWTPTADELQYLIDNLRAQAQLKQNYAREERCLAAV